MSVGEYCLLSSNFAMCVVGLFFDTKAWPIYSILCVLFSLTFFLLLISPSKDTAFNNNPLNKVTEYFLLFGVVLFFSSRVSNGYLFYTYLGLFLMIVNVIPIFQLIINKIKGNA